MQITLKNLKTLASLSEETHCFTATVYVDGKPAFNASNHGHGGPDMYQPIPPFTHGDIKRVDEWLKANKPADTSYGITIEHSLEIEVGELINRALAEKRLARLLKNKVVVIGENKGQPALFTYNAKPTPENLERAKASPTLKGRQIVNGNKALEEKALELC